MGVNEPKEDLSARSTGVLVSALRRMLRPLILLLIERQIHYPILSRVIKGLYLDVAEKEFALSGKPMTVSRLSLLTGIQRRQVNDFRQEHQAPEESRPRSAALGSQVIASWTGEAPWIDEGGRPRPLLRRSGGDPESLSFQRLVESVSGDIHSRSVLDEWLRLGVVRLTADGYVVLDSGAFVPVHGFEEKAQIMGRNVRDHLAAARHNLAEEENPFFERSVYYGSLPPEAVTELSSLAEDLGQAALRQVHQRALQLKRNAARRTTPTDAARERITFGIYLFTAPSEDLTSAQATGPEEATDEDGHES